MSDNLGTNNTFIFLSTLAGEALRSLIIILSRNHTCCSSVPCLTINPLPFENYNPIGGLTHCKENMP